MLSGWLIGLAMLIILFLLGRKMQIQNKGALLLFFTDAGIEPEAARILVAQSLHETGNFKSKVFRENNNLFGMKEASVRPETADGTRNGHAFYSNPKESAEDMLLWLKYSGAYTTFGKGLKLLTNPYKYVLWLKSKRYFEDTINNYYNGVVKWMKTI